MGSLMAGWNSPVLNSKQAGIARSTSFTREEIEDFWNRKKNAEEEHRRAAADLAMELKAQQTETVDGNSTHHINSEQLPSVEEELEKLNSFRDWWTKTNWAFLNEPAMKRMEAGNLYKYTTQFHVAAPPTTSPAKND